MQANRRRVLEAIADGPVDGPAIAADIDVSRSAVWKHVEALREAGFVISSGDGGYELEDVPEFGGAAVEYDLDAPFALEYHDSIDSTNRRARALADEGSSDVVVLAGEQTGGRGRLDREWSSPPGGIYASVLCRPAVPPGHVPAFTMVAAVAVAQAAREAGVDARIKWPNDVVVGEDERKLAGILTEMEGEADRVSWVAVGLGVNANVDPDALETEATATSLQAEVGSVDRRRFTQRVLEGFDDHCSDLEGAIDAWREYAITLGRQVRVETPTETIEGEAIDVAFPGTLRIETGERVRTVSAGDCEHLRPTSR